MQHFRWASCKRENKVAPKLLLILDHQPKKLLFLCCQELDNRCKNKIKTSSLRRCWKIALPLIKSMVNRQPKLAKRSKTSKCYIPLLYSLKDPGVHIFQSSPVAPLEITILECMSSHIVYVYMACSKYIRSSCCQLTFFTPFPELTCPGLFGWGSWGREKLQYTILFGQGIL